MVIEKTLGRRLFIASNYTLLTVMALLCLLPLVHVLALSLSSNAAASAGAVKLWPVGFNTSSYEFVLRKDAFLDSFMISIQRVLLAVPTNILLITLMAYPLSKEPKQFKFRGFFVWYFVITILFGGGLIPTYMTVKMTGLLDTIWALILPNAVQVFSAVILLNFFRGLPKDLEEAAFMDGAGHFQTLFRIYLPLSLPAIATLVLFSVVGHWNAWFDGLIYMNQPQKYPLQSYLQTVIVDNDFNNMTIEEFEMMRDLSNRTVKAAQIFLAAMPVIVVYPFLQKYFIKGIVLGSVKE